MLLAQREQYIWPKSKNQSPFRFLIMAIILTTYTAVMFPTPGRKRALAVIALFAEFVIHPVVLRQACNAEHFI